MHFLVSRRDVLLVIRVNILITKPCQIIIERSLVVLILVHNFRIRCKLGLLSSKLTKKLLLSLCLPLLKYQLLLHAEELLCLAHIIYVYTHIGLRNMVDWVLVL